MNRKRCKRKQLYKRIPPFDMRFFVQNNILLLRFGQITGQIDFRSQHPHSKRRIDIIGNINIFCDTDSSLKPPFQPDGRNKPIACHARHAKQPDKSRRIKRRFFPSVCLRAFFRQRGRPAARRALCILDRRYAGRNRRFPQSLRLCFNRVLHRRRFPYPQNRKRGRCGSRAQQPKQHNAPEQVTIQSWRSS